MEVSKTVTVVLETNAEVCALKDALKAAIEYVTESEWEMSKADLAFVKELYSRL